MCATVLTTVIRRVGGLEGAGDAQPEFCKLSAV